MDRRGVSAQLEVDGGVNIETAPLVARAGADIAVAGSAVYDYPEGVEAAIRRLKDALAVRPTP